MRWFKHDTDAKEDVKIKLLEKRHGLVGYAVYFKTLEIIGKAIDTENVNDWGFVETVHTIETLAESVGIESGQYRDIVTTCDELGLFSQFNGRLYCEKILFRLDEYASKIVGKKGLEKLINQRRKQSGQTPDKLPTVSGQCRARIDKNRTDKNRTDKNRPQKSWDDKKPSNDELQRIADKYQVSIAFVESKWDDLVNWCAARGKDNYYKDWSRALADWVKRDSIKLNNERRGNARRIAVIPIPE